MRAVLSLSATVVVRTLAGRVSIGRGPFLSCHYAVVVVGAIDHDRGVWLHGLALAVALPLGFRRRDYRPITTGKSGMVQACAVRLGVPVHDIHFLPESEETFGGFITTTGEPA